METLAGIGYIILLGPFAFAAGVGVSALVMTVTRRPFWRVYWPVVILACAVMVLAYAWVAVNEAAYHNEFSTVVQEYATTRRMEEYRYRVFLRTPGFARILVEEVRPHGGTGNMVSFINSRGEWKYWHEGLVYDTSVGAGSDGRNTFPPFPNPSIDGGADFWLFPGFVAWQVPMLVGYWLIPLVRAVYRARQRI